jgi:hypothetical protein
VLLLVAPPWYGHENRLLVDDDRPVVVDVEIFDRSPLQCSAEIRRLS